MFSNLRARGSSLCDIAVLVVSCGEGIEEGTVECMKMMKELKVPFVVAVNKIDNIYGWKPHPNLTITKCLKQQEKYVNFEYEQKLKRVTCQFAEHGFNSAVFYKNSDFKKWISLVPISAK
jgi:translation initiation factor 5B